MSCLSLLNRCKLCAHPACLPVILLALSVSFNVSEVVPYSRHEPQAHANRRKFRWKVVLTVRIQRLWLSPRVVHHAVLR